MGVEFSSVVIVGVARVLPVVLRACPAICREQTPSICAGPGSGRPTRRPTGEETRQVFSGRVLAGVREDRASLSARSDCPCAVIFEGGGSLKVHVIRKWVGSEQTTVPEGILFVGKPVKTTWTDACQWEGLRLHLRDGTRGANQTEIEVRVCCEEDLKGKLHRRITHCGDIPSERLHQVAEVMNMGLQKKLVVQPQEAGKPPYQIFALRMLEACECNLLAEQSQDLASETESDMDSSDVGGARLNEDA